MSILNRVLLNNIGKHQPNFAVAQHTLANSVKQFVMCVTGNSEVSKEILAKNINYISQDGSGVSTVKDSTGMIFIKRILERVDILSKIEEVEDRFLPDGDK